MSHYNVHYNKSEFRHVASKFDHLADKAHNFLDTALMKIGISHGELTFAH